MLRTPRNVTQFILPRLRYAGILVLIVGLWVQAGFAAETPTRSEAAASLDKAVAFFRNQVATEGGYLWRYSADLARREGEGKASETTAWVQPPGTPSVGEAYLYAYQRTGSVPCMEAALAAAYALVFGQLTSGGWDYRICYDPSERLEYAYRIAPAGEGGQNVTTLDDDVTQSAVRFLVRMDKQVGGGSTLIHDAVAYALESLLKAQYPNGAWPQRYSGPPNPDDFPVKAASYPESWPRSRPKKDYRSYYTFNDNTIADVIVTMLDAADAYDDERYRAAAKKAGDFILLAQMPDPQPAWAQQYDADMHPAWARKFEPPSITGNESQGVMRTLLILTRRTGEAKYLGPIPEAISYLRSSRLPDGRLARFYELKSNTPLYFTKDYKLTYSDDDMPTHYGFKASCGLDAIEAEYDEMASKPSIEVEKPRPRSVRLTTELAERAGDVIRAMDERGAWVEKSRLRYHGDDDPTTEIIDCRTFSANLRILADYIAACDAESQR